MDRDKLWWVNSCYDTQFDSWLDPLNWFLLDLINEPVVPTSLSREAPPEAEAATESIPSPSNQQQLLPPSKSHGAVSLTSSEVQLGAVIPDVEQLRQLSPDAKEPVDSGHLKTPSKIQTAKSRNINIVDSSKISEKVSARLGQQVAKPGAKRRPYVYEVPDPAQGRPLDQRIWRMVKPRVLPPDYIASPKSMEMLDLLENQYLVPSVHEQPEEDIGSIRVGRSLPDDKPSTKLFFKAHGRSL